MLQKFKPAPVGYTEVYAWGDDEFGQLGVSGKKNSIFIIPPFPLNKFPNKNKPKTIQTLVAAVLT